MPFGIHAENCILDTQLGSGYLLHADSKWLYVIEMLATYQDMIRIKIQIIKEMI